MIGKEEVSEMSEDYMEKGNYIELTRENLPLKW
jgi:hypothetical protein